MGNDDKHAGDREDQFCNTSVRTNSPVIKISREELSSLIQVEQMYAVEIAHREKMRRMSRNLAEETISDVLTTGYCAATD